MENILSIHYDSELYSAKEFAGMLGLSVELMRHLLKMGIIKGKFIGSSWVVPSSEYEAIIKGKSPAIGTI